MNALQESDLLSTKRTKSEQLQGLIDSFEKRLVEYTAEKERLENMTPVPFGQATRNRLTLPDIQHRIRSVEEMLEDIPTYIAQYKEELRQEEIESLVKEVKLTMPNQQILDKLNIGLPEFLNLLASI